MRSNTPARAAAFLFLALLDPAGKAADQPLPAGDSSRGNILFHQSCALCHSTGHDARPTGGQGPLLAGVMGRPAASLYNFGYTKALTASHLMWDSDTMDRFLANPGALVPGTNMAVIVADPKDRSDLIAFLATLAPVAPPTPNRNVSSIRRVPTPGDWENDRPGMRHRIRLEDLPAPYATASAGNSPAPWIGRQAPPSRSPPDSRSSCSLPVSLRTAAPARGPQRRHFHRGDPPGPDPRAAGRGRDGHPFGKHDFCRATSEGHLASDSTRWVGTPSGCTSPISIPL